MGVLEELRLRNCPREYYENCRNAAIWCQRCVAGWGSSGSSLRYDPIDTSLTPHPYQPDWERGRRVRRARREESRAKNAIIQQTVNSGAIFGDGDYRLLHQTLRGEHKHRQNSKSFSLSYAEYQKGRSQGVSCWIITNSEGERVVILTEAAFAQLAACYLDEIDKGE